MRQSRYLFVILVPPFEHLSFSSEKSQRVPPFKISASGNIFINNEMHFSLKFACSCFGNASFFTLLKFISISFSFTPFAGCLRFVYNHPVNHFRFTPKACADSNQFARAFYFTADFAPSPCAASLPRSRRSRLFSDSGLISESGNRGLPPFLPARRAAWLLICSSLMSFLQCGHLIF